MVWERELIENIKRSKLQNYCQKRVQEIMYKIGDNKAVNGVGQY